MVLDNTKATVAYRCPSCGSLVRSIVGIFSLTADSIKLKCPCGGSHLELSYTRDRKIRLSVPCFICPNPHNFTVSTSVFAEDGAISLVCPFSGVDICFIGGEDAVLERVAESEKELSELLGDAGITDFSKGGKKGGELTDPMVSEIVAYVIKELEDEGALFCGCPDNEGDYEVKIGDAEVTVRCRKCGRLAHLPADSISAARAFLEIDKLTLT
ncbi:MAG: hypothetical protein IJS78_03545 [Clostridia bacterium]|nr:hypothetical protein [Clostridia bacterium]